MFFRLLLLFLLIPWLELFLLFQIGAVIGFWGTVSLILFTAVVGAWLSREQGVRAMARIRQAMAEGRMPTDEVVDGFLIFGAGLILLTPGFLTDTVGFLALIPGTRQLLRRGLVKGFRRHVTVVHGIDPSRTRQRPAEPDVIDVSAEPVDTDEDERR